MPARWEFKIGDRIVIAALREASVFLRHQGSLWWDEDLVKAINTEQRLMQIDNVHLLDVTVQSLNAVFGTKETAMTQLFSALVIRNCTRGGARCEYYFAAQGTSRADFMALQPQWSSEGRSESSESPEVPQSRAPARREAATTPREKVGPSHMVTASSTQKKKKEKKRCSERTAGKSGTPAKQKSRAAEPVDAATLLMGAGDGVMSDEEDETRRELETRLREEFTVALAKKDAVIKKCKDEKSEKRERIEYLEQQLAESAVENLALRKEVDGSENLNKGLRKHNDLLQSELTRSALLLEEQLAQRQPRLAEAFADNLHLDDEYEARSVAHEFASSFMSRLRSTFPLSRARRLPLRLIGRLLSDEVLTIYFLHFFNENTIGSRRGLQPIQQRSAGRRGCPPVAAHDGDGPLRGPGRGLARRHL
jgi:hypothetical protein